MLCVVAECDLPVCKRGFCGAHYKRWWRHGDPLAGGTPKGELRRFVQDIVLQFSEDTCLTWPYSTNGEGYGQMRQGYKKVLVNRVVCVAAHGAPPSPLHEVAHSCGKGHLGCCNPKHLRWATRAENQADRIIHGTSNRKIDRAA